MAAELAMNVGGALVELPARVTDLHARDASEGPRRPGYAIQIEADRAALATRPDLAKVLPRGSPAAIAIARPLFPDLRHAAIGLCARLTGAACGQLTWPARLPVLLPMQRPAPPLFAGGDPGAVEYLAAFGEGAARPDRLPDAD